MFGSDSTSMPTENYQTYVDIENNFCIIENVSFFNNMHIFLVIQNLHLDVRGTLTPNVHLLMALIVFVAMAVFMSNKGTRINVSCYLQFRISVLPILPLPFMVTTLALGNRRIRLFVVGILWSPFYWHALTLIQVSIGNHMLSDVWDEIIYPFPNFKGTTVEVWEWKKVHPAF